MSTSQIIAQYYEDALTELYDSSPSHSDFYSDLKDYVKGKLWEEASTPILEKAVEAFIVSIDFGEVYDIIEQRALDIQE